MNYEIIGKIKEVDEKAKTVTITDKGIRNAEKY